MMEMGGGIGVGRVGMKGGMNGGMVGVEMVGVRDGEVGEKFGG